MKPQAATSRTTVPLGVELRWLGQAGFVIDVAGIRIVIDPYLSNSLAEKYRGKVYDHRRMMPIPIDPHQLTGIDLVLCTHGHTDHMDPLTLRALAHANPAARFVVPQYEQAKARQIGLPADRLVFANAGQTLQPLGGHELSILVTPAAHESFEQDADGHHRFLGYILTTERARVYHSGDTLAVDALSRLLVSEPIDVALMPCNGRDAIRRGRGVPGNMSLHEAIGLCRLAQIPTLVPHHFGMFDFNTCSLDELRCAAKDSQDPRVLLPSIHDPLCL